MTSSSPRPLPPAADAPPLLGPAARLPTFEQPGVVGLAAGLVALVFYTLPRLEMSMAPGGNNIPFPWELPGLAAASAWGGILGLVPGLIRRKPLSSFALFLIGWGLAFLGVAIVNPSPWVHRTLESGVRLLGILPPGHLMGWLDRMARTTEIPISLALLVLLWGIVWRARFPRILLAILAAEAVLPVLWFFTAAARPMIPMRHSLVHSVNFFLLMAQFAACSALPWLILASRPAPTPHARNNPPVGR